MACAPGRSARRRRRAARRRPPVSGATIHAWSCASARRRTNAANGSPGWAAARDQAPSGAAARALTAHVTCTFASACRSATIASRIATPACSSSPACASPATAPPPLRYSHTNTRRMTTSFPLAVVPVVDVLGGRVVRAQRGERASYRPIVSLLAAAARPGDDRAGAAVALARRPRCWCCTSPTSTATWAARRRSPRCRHLGPRLARPGAVDRRRLRRKCARRAGACRAPGLQGVLARGVRQRVDRRSGGAGRPGGRPARHPLARCLARAPAGLRPAAGSARTPGPAPWSS